MNRAPSIAPRDDWNSAAGTPIVTMYTLARIIESILGRTVATNDPDNVFHSNRNVPPAGE